MTFCSFYEDCTHGLKCSRALTPKIIRDAKNWGLGVCEYADRPDCFEQLLKIKGKYQTD